MLGDEDDVGSVHDVGADLSSNDKTLESFTCMTSENRERSSTGMEKDIFDWWGVVAGPSSN